MNPVLQATRLGVLRGLMEFRHSLTERTDLFWLLFMNGGFITVLVFQRDSTIAGIQLASLTLPSLLGMSVVTGGVMGVCNVLAAHREDGTLLRAKATPNGMVGYLVAQMVFNTVNTVFGLLVLVVTGLFLLDGLAATEVTGWLTLLWVLALGLLASLPWGAVIGSLVKSSAAGFGLTFLPVSGLIAISGIFYPIAALPGWLQGVAQVFPVYWLGLGMRSALLPDAAAAAEIGGSWRQLGTAGVLGLWAVAGLLIAPSVLRRMARRESGSAMQSRKERILARGY